MASAKADPGAVRSHNRRLVLDFLRRDGPQSRARLADLTGLSAPSVTAVVNALMNEGIVIERSLATSSGGRPPVLLDLNYDAYYAVGLKLMEDRIEAGLTDLATRPLARVSVEVARHDPVEVAERSAEAVSALVALAHVDRARLIGVGIGVSGIVDAVRGVCVSTPRLGWRDVPIARLVGEATGAAAWADNDVNAFAAAEGLFGSARQARSFVAVTIGRGLGAGIVVDGRVLHGSRGSAAEFGHGPLVPGGRLCECGKRGCLEAYVSEPNLIAAVNEADPDLKVRDASALLHLLQGGHPHTARIVAEAGRRLGQGLAWLSNILGPELIVVGGEGVRLGEAFFAPMRAALAEQTHEGVSDGIPVVVDDWGDDAWARGAASIAVQRALDEDVLGPARRPGLAHLSVTR
jgi:predicted NBD/HSP70 family sugar kinase